MPGTTETIIPQYLITVPARSAEAAAQALASAGVSMNLTTDLIGLDPLDDQVRTGQNAGYTAEAINSYLEVRKLGPKITKQVSGMGPQETAELLHAAANWFAWVENSVDDSVWDPGDASWADIARSYSNLFGPSQELPGTEEGRALTPRERTDEACRLTLAEADLLGAMEEGRQSSYRMDKPDWADEEADLLIAGGADALQRVRTFLETGEYAIRLGMSQTAEIVQARADGFRMSNEERLQKRGLAGPGEDQDEAQE